MDEDRRVQARAVMTGGLVALVLFGANAAIVAWGRPARTVAVAGAVSAVLMMSYVHLVRFSASRPVRWGPFRGLSWAEMYRVTDALARGDAVLESRLARPALDYAQRLRRTARFGVWVVPLFVVSFLGRLAGGDLGGREIANGILNGVVIAAFVVWWRPRIPRIRQAEERTKALHPSN